MATKMIDKVALALFASDGLKLASGEITLQQSWDMSPQLHVTYRERAIVFLKVMGEQMLELAEAEISALDKQRRAAT
ncbi:hypothetical protein [Devosia sp. 1566]|uniref:hypothetical protein n=1 Tax=Devosia sp. 1566 TaxID=2499144 RepID=UPI000FDAEC09|nr:hypothetical protein [Devosia sp. 1566]